MEPVNAGLSGASQPIVLVVEDNELNLKLFCAVLKQNGYDVDGERDGRKVMERVLERTPDLIVMDIQLPGIGGIELIQQIKDNPRLAQMPIMAVTAYAAAGDESRIRLAGADAYVAKPVTLKSFLAVVRDLTPKQSS